MCAGADTADAATDHGPVEGHQELAANQARSAAGANASSSSTGAQAITTSTLSPSAAELEFYLAVEVRYHEARASFLMTAHRLAMFATIVLGSAVIGSIGNDKIVGLTLAAIGAAEMAFDPAGRSAEHRIVGQKYSELLVRLASSGHDAGRVAEIFRAMVEAGKDDPAEYRTAKLIAHNHVIRSLGRDTSKIEHVPVLKRAIAQIWRGE